MEKSRNMISGCAHAENAPFDLRDECREASILTQISFAKYHTQNTSKICYPIAPLSFYLHGASS